ncbi:MAG: hypothetical protein ACK4YP_17685 [Myxococcota bacterium]
MNAKEALDRVREAPDDGAAWRVIEAELARLAQGITSNTSFAEAAVRAVRAKLEDQAMSRDLEEVTHPAAWLAKALRWRIVDESRRQERAGKLAQKVAEEARRRQELEIREPEPFGPRLVAAMEEVYEKAVSRRDPWQREHLTRAWRQIQALHTTRLTLKQIVAEDDAIALADEEAVRLAVQRAHKQHQRARADLRDALDVLAGQRKLDPEMAALVRGALTRLKRRQDRTAGDVSRLKGQPDDT